MNYLELLLGVVFYDSRGLPQKFFTVEGQSIRWSEQAFQMLGLEQFIRHTLDLPPFDYGTLHHGDRRIVITSRPDGYIACLSPQPVPPLWLQNLLPQALADHPRFLSL